MNTETLVTIILAIIGSSGLFTLIQFLISRNDGKKQAMEDLMKAIVQLQSSVDDTNADMKLQNEALMSIAQDRIMYLAREFLSQNWIYADDLSNLRRLADSYRALEGNGDVKILMDLVDKLPVRVRGGHGHENS